MPSKIYKVFLSSTFEDLKEERKEVIEGLLSNKCMPVAMEFFESSDEKPTDLINRLMGDCDFFVLIIKGKYGSIDPDTGKSFTEMEYEKSLELKIPVLGFLYYDFEQLKAKEIELDSDRREKLASFQNRIKASAFRKWTDATDLRDLISTSLTKKIDLSPAAGFTKANPLDKAKSLIIPFHKIDVQEKKTSYVQFLHLTKRPDNKQVDTSLYSRYISRLQESVPVYDEYVFYQINEFSEEVSEFEMNNSTSGTVELNILNPWQPQLFFPEGVTESIAGEVGQTYAGSAKTFISASHFFNAFQKNQYIRTKIEKATKNGTLIVDFRYLANQQKFIDADKITGSVNKNKSIRKVEVFKGVTDAENNTVPLPGLFWISADNLQKGDILNIDFGNAIKWDEIQATL